jgi:protein-S-isoprenylcysteine O-methyltransferase Ste14
MNHLKSLIFLIIAPGMMAGFIPLAFFRNGPQTQTGIFSYLALPFWAVGIAILLWSFWDFAQRGLGTPAPIDPPKRLVMEGLYRYTRNPMYVGVLLVILGHFLWSGYWVLMAYGGLFFIATHLFIVLYEEPHLKKTFGADYDEYCRRVSRWIPKIKSFSENV